MPKMKFALVTADRAHQKKIYMDGERSDVTSFMSWIRVWDGIHLSFEALRAEDRSYLSDFDVVMFSGHPNHIQDIIDIARELKNTSAVTMYYPEGSLQLYDNSINGFHPEYVEAWNACDIVSSAEEDKLGYYESFVSRETLVRFIHVPLTREMEDGYFFIPRYQKNPRLVLVYGDNNPNHPMIAMAAAHKLGADVIGADIRGHDFGRILPGLKTSEISKLGQYPFLRVLGRTVVHFYPTEWIGTARQAIACACVGTPCIGNRDSHTQKRLFPKLGFQIYDIPGMVEAAKWLIDDQTLYNETVAHARASLHFYGLEATKKRFMEAVEDARKLKKTQVDIGALT